MHKVAKMVTQNNGVRRHIGLTQAPDRLNVKIKNHGLGQYGAEPLIARLPFHNVGC